MNTATHPSFLKFKVWLFPILLTLSFICCSPMAYAKGYVDSLLGETGWKEEMITDSPIYQNASGGQVVGDNAWALVLEITKWLIGIAVVLLVLRIVVRAAVNISSPQLVVEWKWLQSSKERGKNEPNIHSNWFGELIKDSFLYLFIVACMTGLLNVVIWAVLAISKVLVF